MALPTATVGEVRTTGSDTNGGGFCASQPSAGTDYSQQDAPVLSLTDVVTNGTTTVTSATGGFTVAMIGNLINIAGTTFMIEGWASTNSITVERVTGTGTGQTAKVGGAWATPGYACGQIVGGNKVWVKSGTYVPTVVTPNVAGGTMSLPAGTLAQPTRFEGYGTVRGDKIKPFIDATLVGTNPLFNLAGDYTEVDSFQLASLRMCVQINSNYSKAYRITGVGGTYCYYVGSALGASMVDCDGVSIGGQSAFRIDSPSNIYGCTAHDCTLASGFAIGVAGAVLTRCKSYNNHAKGFQISVAATLIHCTAKGNLDSGFVWLSTTQLHSQAISCLSVSNGLYGFQSSLATAALRLMNCATYGNASGATYNLNAVEGMITLTADPFDDPTLLTLNDLPGAGALLRGAAYGGNLSIGAMQQGQAADSAGVTTLLARLTMDRAAALDGVATAAALTALSDLFTAWLAAQPAIPVATVTGAPSATVVTVTGLPASAANDYQGMFFQLVTGAHAWTAARPVAGSSYSAGTTTLTFAGLTVVPNVGDTAILAGSRKAT